MALFKKSKPNKKGNWQREDRLVDYIVSHKGEITKYLVVVLISELLKYGLHFLCDVTPALQPFSNAIIFIVWGLPYFIACKKWVWQQKGDDGYTWAMQSIKFLMTMVVVQLVTMFTVNVLTAVLTSGNVARMLGTLINEVLYFVAMLRFVLKPKK